MNEFVPIKLLTISRRCSYKSGAQPEIFQGKRSFVELGHFDKHFVKNRSISL